MNPLRQPIQQPKSPLIKANASIVCHQGSTSHTFTAASNNGTWIVDSGASHHMTGNFQVFNTFKPCAHSQTVRIDDGSLTPMIETGSITLSDDLLLSSVLFVPKLNCNLLSISKLTRDLHCVTKFYPNLCKFQVDGSEKVIGSAEMHDGLYILKASSKTFVHVYDHNRTKLDPKSHKCIFIGVYNTMDVTFFEHQPFFPKSGIQGEHSHEYQFWKILQNHQAVFPQSNVMAHEHQSAQSLPSLPLFSVQLDINPENTSNPSPDYTSNSSPENSSNPSFSTLNPTSPSSSKNPNTLSNSPPLQTQAMGNKELRVYSKRKVGNIEANMQDKICSNTHHSPLNLENHEGKDFVTHELVSPTTDDLDLPIAHRKGVRTCTNHPIEKYVYYGILTPMYRAFVSSLDLIQIPTEIYKALKDPKWKSTIDEEMNALEKNGTWDVTELHQGKPTVGCK
uniref:Polyprotein n=1 Tax=Cannabis sativa TaxID=3483 RepID=A0A803NGP2_CANSA